MKVLVYPNAAARYAERCVAVEKCLPDKNRYNTLRMVQDRWLAVEVDFLFSDQYNVTYDGSGFRLLARDVKNIDYCGCPLLEVIHRLMRVGSIQCHSCLFHKKKFVDSRTANADAVFTLAKRFLAEGSDVKQTIGRIQYALAV